MKEAEVLLNVEHLVKPRSGVVLSHTIKCSDKCQSDQEGLDCNCSRFAVVIYKKLQL